ncbi:hypothetical protein ASPZODRAFT_12684 [Penicilliopsis zonata CBS 506.65]|uniref:Uncharacterized protein n=1 Tax=Penicilliopsis zonata CBS 506.65 TaxID=1073090 RepID=A0A1L9SR26_9EURO|nr:hypothetical protein ASPZODRAFT_12684 [Penicilliopsis zonata CBS 506.65]OJJ49553.1 hypothetical protein ASPZODRAFT_12684 [Penicilliopsis zonata CBS 506.65]
MSSESLPISLAAFAEAIKELPLSSVFAKASEIHNSIAHLRRSNDEIKAFIADSHDTESEKSEMESYIAENEQVMASMLERIQLLKKEVEDRGQQWIDMDASSDGQKQAVEEEEARLEAPASNGVVGGENHQPVPNGSANNAVDEDQGVYL